MFTNEVFDFLDGLSAVKSGAMLAAAMRRTLNKLGVEYFSLNLLPRPNEEFKDELVVNHLPAGWLDLYLREGFARYDPAVRRCHSSIHPFRYQDASFDAAIDPEALNVVRRARDFSVDNGLVVPIADASGSAGLVYMGGPNAQLDSRSSQLVHLLALYSFELAERLVNVAKPAARLTEREKEILKWIACGKCADDIGEILRISKRTVEWHVASAMQKLSAKTRTHAVIIAHRCRLIEV
jgi:LuxR family quorum sensing-dependent transcriptional regulator